jgi:hypothetical protein
MRGIRHLTAAFLVALSFTLPAAEAAQAQTGGVLTNADVVRMAHAGIAESIIVREIQMSETDFGTGSDALIDLKSQGVSNRVLGAMLDSHSAKGGIATRSLPITPGASHSSSATLHHLPSFDADVRLNSQAVGKISVRQSHISVSRGGVPIFSLNWKVKRTP